MTAKSVGKSAFYCALLKQKAIDRQKRFLFRFYLKN